MIAPLMDSAPSDRELEAYAQAQGTTGDSLRNWLWSYLNAKSVDALMPKRVNRRHMRWVEEIEARNSSEGEGRAKPLAMAGQRLAWMAVNMGDVPSQKQEQIGMRSPLAAREIGRLRQVAVEQANLRRGDRSDGGYWLDVKGLAELNWYLLQKDRPETLRLWCCAYEKAVREVAMLLALPGTNEAAALERAVLDRDISALRQLRWATRQIEKAIDRARTAGAKALEPVTVTSKMLLELRNNVEALKHRGTKTFIVRAQHCVDPIPF